MTAEAAGNRPLVLIIEDDDAVREAIEELFISVGMEAVSFRSARDFLEFAMPDRPGCMVLDVRLPGISGLDVQSHLAASGKTKPIVFLTGHGDIPMSVQAMKAGAVDFLTKPFRDQDLLDAVTLGVERDVSQRSEALIISDHVGRHSSLTARERQVLERVALGRLNKQIAFDLGISEVTVKLHRSSVMKKMRVNTVGELIRAWEILPSRLRDGSGT